MKEDYPDFSKGPFLYGANQEAYSGVYQRVGIQGKYAICDKKHCNIEKTAFSAAFKVTAATLFTLFAVIGLLL